MRGNRKISVQIESSFFKSARECTGIGGMLSRFSSSLKPPTFLHIYFSLPAFHFPSFWNSRHYSEGLEQQILDFQTAEDVKQKHFFPL